MNQRSAAIFVANTLNVYAGDEIEWVDWSETEDGRVGVILSDGTVFNITVTSRAWSE